MKKFIVFIIAIVSFCSCATTYVSQTYGDVSILNYSGEQIRKYDNAVIDSETTTTDGFSYVRTDGTYGIKASGALNFKDGDGEYHYVSGGIIIIDNLHSKTAVSNGKESTDDSIKREETIKKIRIDYLLCKAQIESNKERMKSIPKESDEYIVLTEQNKRMREKMKGLREDAYKLGYNNVDLR